MNYFTKDWCLGRLNEEEIESRIAQYSQYINNIYYTIPLSLRIIAKHISFHDGMIEGISINEKDCYLVINAISGDLQEGYSNIKIKYLNTCNNYNKKNNRDV